MSDTNHASALPVSFRVIAGIGLLWNSIGAGLYLLARLDPQSVMGSAPQEMQDYAANMPLWANIGYGFGIWASFAGSMLMLLRSRHAVTAFVVSFVGAAASFGAQALAGVLGPAEPALILSVIALLWWYCRRARGLGILK